MTESLYQDRVRPARVLSHVHTRRSHDAWITPAQIVRYAREADIDVVLVTDHNTHWGSLDCQRVAETGGPVFPMCAEYRSLAGDIIAAFLKSPIPTHDPMGIIEEAHTQGGLVILPHPFKGSCFSDDVFESADIIETFNPRCTHEQNRRAEDTARQLGKPALAGSDAHFVAELGLTLNTFENRGGDLQKLLLTGARSFHTDYTTRRRIRRSQMLKSVRRAQPLAFAKNVVRWLQAGRSETP